MQPHINLRIFLLLVSLSICANLYAQVDIQWQQLSNDIIANRPIHLVKMSDGSFITVGHRFETFNHNNPDVCNSGYSRCPVIKYKPDGTEIWRRCIGVDRTFRGVFALETENNGLLVVGYGSANYLDQIRIYRLDSLANILWMRSFGGSGQDRAFSATRTNDGGFVIVGESNASDNDLVGTGMHVSGGSFDQLVFKLNASGDIIWKKCFGGTGFENIKELTLIGSQVLEMPDGTLMVAGRTTSNDGDVSGNHGGDDAWLVKLSSGGTLIWQKCFGDIGNEQFLSIDLASDGLILVGSTTSNAGMVSGNHGAEDVWLVKTDFDGNLQWQKCIGGTGKDIAANIGKLSDGYAITGYSFSADGDLQQNFGMEDGLIGKVDLSGNLLWLKNYGGSERDWFQNIVPLSNSKFLVCGATFSNNHDLHGNQHPNCAWILSIGEVNKVSGKAFLDLDSNGALNGNEQVLINIPIQSTKDGALVNFGYTDSAGTFNFTVDTGSILTRPALHAQYFSTNPIALATTHTGYGAHDTVVFAVSARPGMQDLAVILLPTSPTRAGQSATYHLVCFNQGTTAIPAATIRMEFDSLLSFQGSTQPYQSLVGRVISWDINNLLPFDSVSIGIKLGVPLPPVVSMGSLFRCKATAEPLAGDSLLSNNIDSLVQLVIGSFDPNDKSEAHGNRIRPSALDAGDALNYFIRFQNVGNDTAFQVVVRDTLDPRLNFSSFEMVDASHPYQLKVENGNILVWRFENILLPDSTTNESASHGWISFRVKPTGGLFVGDTLHNTASIYFDFNLPVRTNDAYTIVENNFTVLPVSLLDFYGILEGNMSRIYWRVSDAINFDRIEIERSFDGVHFVKVGTSPYNGDGVIHDYKFSENISSLRRWRFYYRLKLFDLNGTFTYSNVVMLYSDTDSERIFVYPNPARTQAFLSIQANQTGRVVITIRDRMGNLVVKQQHQVIKGVNVISLMNITQLPGGSYFASVEQKDVVLTTKFTVVQ